MDAINRTMGATSESQRLAMAMMLYSMPRPVKQVEALCVFCGMGEHWRIVEAINVWQGFGSMARHLFILEQFRPDNPFTHLTMDLFKGSPYFLCRTEGVELISIPNTRLGSQSA